MHIIKHRTLHETMNSNNLERCGEEDESFDDFDESSSSAGALLPSSLYNELLALLITVEGDVEEGYNTKI